MNYGRKDPSSVLEYLSNTNGAHVKEIAKHMDISTGRAGELMCRWKKEGLVDCVGGGSGLRLWVLPWQAEKALLELNEIRKAKAKVWSRRTKEKAKAAAKPLERSTSDDWMPTQVRVQASQAKPLEKLGFASVWEWACQ